MAKPCSPRSWRDTCSVILRGTVLVCCRMASGGTGPSLLDRVSCSICMDQFDGHIHVPKILPCQHTFCLSCLDSMSTYQMTIVCPVCREEIDIPANGYTTNRALLDVVEELQKDVSFDATKSSIDVPRSPAVLKCLVHDNAECVLLCVDCLDGLCLKCIKKCSHQNHKLEELADAKSVLWPKFEEQIQNELSVWDAMIALLNSSVYSVVEINQAETEFKIISDKMESVFSIWRSSQLTKLTEFKEEAINRENEIRMQREKLQSLLVQNDINIENLVTKLKEPHSIEQQIQSSNNYIDLKGAQTYKFGLQCQTFLESLQSVLRDLLSQASITSKFLKQAFGVMPEDVRHHEKGAARSDVAVDTSDITEGLLDSPENFHGESLNSKPPDVKPKHTTCTNSSLQNNVITDIKSTAAKPVDRKLTEPKAIDAKPMVAQLTDTSPADTIPMEANAKEAKPKDANPEKSKTVNAVSVETKPTDSKATETKPMDAKAMNERVEDAVLVDANPKSVDTESGSHTPLASKEEALKNVNTEASKVPKSQCSECYRSIQFVKVVGQPHKSRLVCQINTDVMFYHFKTRTCEIIPKGSSGRKTAQQALKNSKDIQSESSYEKHLDAVKKYYLSL